MKHLTREEAAEVYAKEPREDEDGFIIQGREWQTNEDKYEAFKAGQADERNRSQALVEALFWISAIQVAPKESWPTHQTIAEVANKAIELYEKDV